jgi:hypothetical protein
MTTKEQAARMIETLREKGYSDDEIAAAVVDLLQDMIKLK